ncbi:peptide deformylase [Lysinibacillus composti]|uniref:Peptide deformylase n=1 Tax=Lysinibacillus composti TaxID=720633 RepID=A0A3N9UFT3_9BACI|nr:peptide deformylase [Lysinibacillus composti]MBM7608305.1 peptide deformylase [Lysinibacillus composti]RQW75014.1 peptide deformylase [Lysinibacillus composti]
MAIKEVVKHPAAVLTQKCEEVTEINEDIIQLLDDLYDTMVEHDGVGIAAPQIGVPLRVAIVELGEERDVLEMINPTVLIVDGKEVDIEGCLSFPGLFGEVERPTYVKIEACDREGRVYELEAGNFDARAILHEIDHLDGVLFDSKIIRVVTEEELAEMYGEEE